MHPAWQKLNDDSRRRVVLFSVIGAVIVTLIVAALMAGTQTLSSGAQFLPLWMPIGAFAGGYVSIHVIDNRLAADLESALEEPLQINSSQEIASNSTTDADVTDASI